MNKIFLRTGAWYSSETPALSDDLELSALLPSLKMAYAKGEVNEKINDLWKQILELPPPIEKPCNCKNDIAALNERIDVLTKDFNDDKDKWTFVGDEPKKETVDDKPASIPAKKSVPKKPVAKKEAVKKPTAKKK